MFFKKRKSRKQLLQEIEELKDSKRLYLNCYQEQNNALISINKKIKDIHATCISSGNTNNQIIEDCLCRELIKEIMPYVSYERYAMVGEHWNGECKYVATIKIVED